MNNENQIINSLKNILNSNINITFFKNNIRIFKQFTIKINYYILNNDDNIFDFVSKNRFYICCKIHKNYNKKLLLFFKNNNYSIDDFIDNFRQYKIIDEFNDEFNIYNLFQDKLNINKKNNNNDDNNNDDEKENNNDEDKDNNEDEYEDNNYENDENDEDNKDDKDDNNDDDNKSINKIKDKEENNKDEEYYIINEDEEINYKLLYLSIFSIIIISIKPLFSFCNNSYTFTRERIKKNLNNKYNENVIIMKINLLNENFRLKYYLKEYNDISNYNEEDKKLNEYVYNNKLYKSYYSVRMNDYSYDFTLNSKYDIDYKINFLTILFNYFFYIF